MKLISRLSELIEPDFGLLESLLRLEVLSRTEYDHVYSVSGAAYRRSKAVLELTKSEDQCGKLMQALKETGQQHVVNFVTQDEGQTDTISREMLYEVQYLLCLYIHHTSLAYVHVLVDIRTKACRKKNHGDYDYY